MKMNADDEKPGSRCSDQFRRNHRPPAGAMPLVINTNEACHYLRISRPTFLKLIAAGKIRAQKLGKGWKVRHTELERFLLAGEIAQQ